ncbi:amino acid adenylation domain-containing protein [Actinoplanes missouriensis]|uniref:amino acid adenylation domain-containing protein n=1 Tax=Actinoplanes missouriensis TaxID=1866 RepID=UPI0033F74238
MDVVTQTRPSLAGEVLAVAREVLAEHPPAPGEPLLPPGADSMTAARLALTLEDLLGTPVPLSWLRDGNDADAVAALAAGAAPQRTGRRLPVEPDRQRHDQPFPPTPLQQAYLVAREPDLTGDPVGCHHYREFRITGVDAARLGAAWAAVARRHPMLRCAVTGGGELRTGAAGTHPPLRVHPEGHDPGEVRDRLSARVYGPGDPWLCEVELTPLPGGDAVLHLAVDGLIGDGHSLRVVLRDWHRAYRDGPGTLPAEEAVSFRDVALALAADTTTDRYADDLRYWERRLDPLPPGPAAVPAPSGGARRPITGGLTATEWDLLRERARRLGVTPTALLLTAFADTLAAAGSARPFTLVLTVSDRPRVPAAADTVGSFTSTLVFPVPAGDAAAVHRQLTADLDHAGVPGLVALRRRRATPPLPVVFTSMIDDPAPESFPETFATSRTSGVALDHQVWTDGGALRFRWDVSGDFPAEELAAAYTARLRDLAGVVHGTLNDLQQAYLVAREQDPAGAAGCRLVAGYRVGADRAGQDEAPDRARLERAPDRARLERALDRLSRRHPVLSARIDTARGRLAPGTPPVVRDAPADPAGLLREPFPDDRHVDVRIGAEEVTLAADLALVDARSIHLLGRELMALYQADADVTPPAPPGTGSAETSPMTAPGTESADASPITALDAEAARRHWEERIAAMPPGPDLPDAPDDGARVRLRGTLPGWRAVSAAAATHGCSPDALLLAAYARAVSPGLGDRFAVPVVRWRTGTDAARPAELTALSWVAVTAENCPLLDLARRYDAVLAADRAADAVSGLAVHRRARRSGGPLPIVYSSVFDLSGHPLPAGVTAGSWATSTPGVALDCVALDDGGDELEYAWDALPARLPDGWLDEAFGRFAAELSTLGALAETPADDPASPPARWNDTGRPFTADLPVHCLIENQARVRPDAPAVRWAGGVLTYAELDRRANRLAWSLREHGVGRGDVVGISARRGPDMVVAVLGVLKAGGAYLPVLPGLPRDRAAVMLGDAAATALLHDTACGWADTIPDVRPIDLDATLASPRPDEHTGPDPVTEVDDLAYVIFTSGSTGRPKGVAVTHRPLHNLIQWAQRTFGFGPGDLGLCVTSLGFDLSVFDILGLLSLGAALYVADDQQQRDPHLLLEVLLTEPVTFWNSAPTTLAHLAPEFAEVLDRDGRDHLRMVFLSGDYTPLWLPDRLRETFPRATLVSLGGATEATVWSNYFVVDRVDPGWRSIPYGRPIDNSRYYVLDEDRRPVPVGVEGDLYIAGECLAAGYYRRPELTAERFVTGAFPGVPETRLYATGDRARFAADGIMHFLGRRDGQVKVRGFRVELPEIEHRLRTHPGVADAVVVLRQGGDSGEDRLVAYVVADGPAPRPDQLRGYAAETLPDYMVPSVVALLDRLPATANGKLDRAALPWPVPQAAPAAATPADQVGPIAALFGELLDQPPVDPDADLWELGATSFTMVRASRLLRERYGREVPVAVLLAEPTVSAIAREMAGVPERVAVAVPEKREMTGVPQQVAVAVPEKVDFFSPEQRQEFKQSRPGQRPERAGATVLPLAGERPTAAQRRLRASRRPAVRQHLDADRLGELLRVLARTEDGTGALYPSAGDTYAVQVYLLVHDGATTGLPAGAYYYRPREHTLEPLGTGADLPATAHVFYNRPYAGRAAAEIYLVGEPRGVAPLYGEHAGRYLALEAGHMAQLLMQQQVPAGVALCPIGDLRRADLDAALGLEAHHLFLLGFLCAPISATGEEPAEPLPAPHRPAVPRVTGDIAVAGMAGRFPGADGPDALWRLLHGGRTAIGPMSPDRAAALGWTGPPPVGGFLDRLGPVDLRPFRISPAEAAVLDPQLRLLLPTVWQCLEDAGHTPESVARNGRVGVFVASMWDDHLAAEGDRWERDGAVETVTTRAGLPNRLSHAFGWRGPSLSVDTACSSSLTALHLAAAALRAGECDSAVVAGVNLVTHRRHIGLLAGIGLLADPALTTRPGGAYDGAAPGWYLGEAVGAVLLRRADSAARDGDQVHGLLEETWCGHAGGEGRFGAPGPGPLAVSLSELMDRAGRDPATVSYVETAAAGAGLADAAELTALTRLLTGARAAVPVGTMKPNLGHAEAAAGIGQLMKVLLQLRHGRIAPTLLAGDPNALVSFADGVLVLAREARDWPPGGEPRVAVVNAVGSGGAYGHLLVRETGGRR